ncbi:MAG: sulfite exporter TauE/SafE family protein [Burkholderiales bacterium]
MLLQLAAAAFAVGLLGGVHCAAMCGGLATALSQADGRKLSDGWRQFLMSSGRVLSYGAAGAFAGSIGGAGLLVQHVLPVQVAFYVLANLLLIGLGLYLAGLSSVITWLEVPGRWLWRHVQPLMRRWIPVDTPLRALAVGMLWGWIPCGLVYTMLATALVAGSATGGALVMLAFGAGTLPNLLGATLILRWLRPRLATQWFRTAAGGLVAGFGLFGLAHAAPLAASLRQGLLCLM